MIPNTSNIDSVPTIERTKDMRILNLDIENIKRVKAVSIDHPSADVQVIGGRNAQGKTSVLDAIWLALGGARASKASPNPVHSGATFATIRVKLGENQPEFVVERKFSKAGRSQLRVTSADGLRYDSPQKMLDTMIGNGNLAYDPISFLRQSPREQVETLLHTIDLGIDLDALDQKRNALFTERTAVNRAVRDSEGQLKQIGDVADVKHAGRPVDAIQADLKKVQSEQKTYDRVKEEERVLADRVSQLRSALNEAQSSLHEHEVWLKANTRPDDSKLFEELQSAQYAAANEERRRIRDDAEWLLSDRKRRAEELTDGINAIDAQKCDAIATAQMPIDGLSFTDDCVTYNGQPLAQCSGAEGIRVSLALAATQKSDIRVILIRDGSLLDEDSMSEVRRFAQEHDVQIWIERVGSADEDALIIEDGEVTDA